MEQLLPKLLNWASILEDQTYFQAMTTSLMPFVKPHLALMPDAHLGLGATVGSVIPTEHAIIPAAVGVDIGCGMIAAQTQWTEDELRNAGGDLTNLRYAIELEVPLSPGRYNSVVRETARHHVEELTIMADKAGFDPASYSGNWELQLGSLGGGNHFIEIVVDENKLVWAFLHSGSRGVGNKIAHKHIKVAKQLCRRWWIDLPNEDLAYLIEDTPEFWTYIRELRWAQHFALLNRVEMIRRVLTCLEDTMSDTLIEGQRINCHHNFTQQERHLGRSVWVSRKGAIEAQDGQWGLIPGSMGAASYVVQGKGNRASLNSAPHGAGRMFSRRAARELFTLEDLRQSMGDIVYRHDEAFLDEHPGAYKDVDVVMKDAVDLVEIKNTFRQIVNVKGQ